MFPAQAQLSAVLRAVSREAVRQICRVFRELFVHALTENAALTDKIQHLEMEMKSLVSKKSSAQTVYKIKPSGQTRGGRFFLGRCHHAFFRNRLCFDRSDGPSLSLDISQPAANPAALAMAILSSTDSIGRTSSNHQVPLVIISQPLPGPVTGQNSSPAPPLASNQSNADDSTVDLVLELDPNSDHSEESLSSTNTASLPVADGAGEATPPRQEAALHVSLMLLIFDSFSF